MLQRTLWYWYRWHPRVDNIVDGPCPFNDDFIDHPRVKKHRVKNAPSSIPSLSPSSSSNVPGPVVAPVPRPYPAPIPALSFIMTIRASRKARLLNRYRRLKPVSTSSKLNCSALNPSSLVVSALDAWIRRRKATIRASANELKIICADWRWMLSLRRRGRRLTSSLRRWVNSSKNGNAQHPVNTIDKTVIDPVKTRSYRSSTE